MKRALSATIICLLIIFSLGSVSFGEQLASSKGMLLIHGKIQDEAENPLENAQIAIYLDGRPFTIKNQSHQHTPEVNEIRSGNNGLYSFEIHAPPEQIKTGHWALEVTRPSFKSSSLIPITNIVFTGNHSRISYFSGYANITLERYHGPAFWIALLVLICVYTVISLELLHRTLAALLGAAVILAITHTVGTFHDEFKILTFEQSLRAVDWNVIFLLMGMMIIVGVLKESGIFQWLAYKSFQLTRGRIFLLAAALCVVTAVLSAFLDNVTTMLLLTPVTIEISLVLGISPFALLLPEIMASNFGGTATLIGDPPNIIIGSYAGLTFNDFIRSLGPVVAFTMVAQLVFTKWYYNNDYNKVEIRDLSKTISFMKEKYQITSPRILYIGGTVLLAVIILFVLHGLFHMEVSVAALLGAGAILILNNADIIKVLERDVEWASLIFFIMLFVIVGAAEYTGILHFVANWIMAVCQNNMILAILLILWVSAILSAIVDNIPFTATMLPIVAMLSKSITGAESGILWWALALGACFGGNGTIIGASANVITTGIAEKSGHKITFLNFFKHSAPITLISLIISSIYLLLYLR